MQAGPVGAAAAARAPSTGSEPPSEGGSAGKADPFDVWLRRGLHRSHDATAAEPIPEELLRLIGDCGEA